MTPEFVNAAVDFARTSRLPLRDAENLFEFIYTKTVLSQNQGNRTKAARALGIHRNTLQRRIDEMRAKGYDVRAGLPGNLARRRN